MNSAYLSPALVEGLGRTIVHSLWQATLLAGVLWLFSRAISSARWRYRLTYGTLLAQFFWSVATFLYVYEPVVLRSVATASVSLADLPFFVRERAVSGSPAEQILPLVVLLWLVALIVGALRLGWSFGRVRRMRRTVKEAVPADLTRRVRSLAERIGYTGRLRLAVSELVDGPALVGHLKPLLLFPVALLNQLSPNEAEAVILHELAHLQRCDHWWNLLQCLLEVLFQYHPMIWWIGARIREEREHCCDDVVLAYGPGGLPYAKALLYFETHRSTPAVAVALTNNPGGLLGRVQRFLHHQNIPYQMKSRLFLLPLLAVITLVATAAYAPDDAPAPAAEPTEIAVNTEATAPETEPASPASLPSPAPAAAAPPELAEGPALVATDSLPAGTHTVSSYRNGKSIKVTIADKKITKLTVDGRQIPAAEFPDYQADVEQLMGGEGSPLKSISSKDGRNIYEFRTSDGADVTVKTSLDIQEKIQQLVEDGAFDLPETDDLSDRLELHFEDLGTNFENLAENFGALGGRFSDLLRYDSDHNTYYFETDSLQLGFRWLADSAYHSGNRLLLQGNVRFQDTDSSATDRFNSVDYKRLNEVREQALQAARKARKEALEAWQQAEENQELSQRALRIALEELREAQPDSKPEINFVDVLQQLQREGLIPDRELRKFVLTDNSLKVNGKRVSAEAYARFVEIYREGYGKLPEKDFRVEINF